MAYRPGTQIIKKSRPTPQQAPTDTGVLFAIGTTDIGPLTPQHLYSMDDFLRVYGTRQTYSFLYDTLDVFFHEGGSHAIVSRVVGPAAISAFKNLLDAGAGVSLVVTAKGPGASGNNLKVAVLAGVNAGFRIQILDQNNVVLETTNDLTTQQDAINWSSYSQWVTITLGATALVPAVAAASALATGADDRTNITDTQRQNALNLFTGDLGPGQVAAPGLTSDTVHAMLTLHAATYNRFDLLDLPDTPTLATLQASAVAARSNGDYGMCATPWVVAPGIVQQTIRVVPPSGFLAGLMARADADTSNPNDPPAADRGIAQYINALSQVPWTDAQRDTLYASGVNVIRTMYGGVRLYGYRTLVDPVATPDWVDAGNARLRMAIVSEAMAIAESYVLRQIDGAGVTIGHFGGALSNMLLSYYSRGALYGATSDQAFQVNVGSTVNTPTRIANMELHGEMAVRMSPDAELVVIGITKIPNLEAIV